MENLPKVWLRFWKDPQVLLSQVRSQFLQIWKPHFKVINDIVFLVTIILSSTLTVNWVACCIREHSRCQNPNNLQSHKYHHLHNLRMCSRFHTKLQDTIVKLKFAYISSLDKLKNNRCVWMLIVITLPMGRWNFERLHGQDKGQVSTLGQSS